jgi:hypothetical protein
VFAGCSIVKDGRRRGNEARAEGNLFRLALSPPSRQNRFDRDAFERDYGADFLTRFCHEIDTGWVMRVTARKT